jgi:hypothetical protein
VDQIQVLGYDQVNRLRDSGVPPERIILKRDRSLVAISGTEQPLARPPDLAGYAVLLYSGNYGVAHEVDTFLDGYRAHHRSGSARVALWLNAAGVNADRVEQGCRASGLPVARTRPLPLALLPRLLVTPDAHLITLRSEFTGFALPSKVYGCIASGRPILYVGDAASDVHYLCERAGLPSYRQVDPGNPDGVAEALEEIAALVAAATPPGPADETEASVAGPCDRFRRKPHNGRAEAVPPARPGPRTALAAKAAERGARRRIAMRFPRSCPGDDSRPHRRYRSVVMVPVLLDVVTYAL